MDEGADHVESALELHVVRLALQLVVPVRQGVVPPLQHDAGRHGAAAWGIPLAKGLQNHCITQDSLSVSDSTLTLTQCGQGGSGDTLYCQVSSVITSHHMRCTYAWQKMLTVQAAIWQQAAGPGAEVWCGASG